MFSIAFDKIKTLKDSHTKEEEEEGDGVHPRFPWVGS